MLEPNIPDLLNTAIRSTCFVKAGFGGAPRRQRDTRWTRIAVRPVEIRGERHYQFEFFDDRQAFARNALDPATLLDEALAVGFANIHLVADGEEIEIRTSKKGKVHVARRPCEGVAATFDHNRAKEHPLAEGLPNRLLETMGIATPDGRVRASLRPKFTQINEFLKLFAHALEPSGLAALPRPLAILDAGCGSSYLTLAVHHYLNDVLKRPATILGVDVNDAVIRKSIERAETIGAAGLSFACGTIGSIDATADIVIALHACDTATDDALAQAVRSEAKLILAAPCCHKHLNRQLKAAGPCEVLRPILRHGILHERAADLLTDAFRALALRILGYRVDVVEFVNLEHTARNLLIRAVRIPDADTSEFVREYREMKSFWGVMPYLETAFGENFRRSIAT
jgi:SAM-dependent methyltransferase